ncbi:hypothetical protein EJ02DRAFT_260752 [Clathrospora elynae]|uniref:Uncharacterized protein n=1 Tax=Clathrospora elynae TaxID=706981 RepID=A0A6A5T0I9_9PLEO|nr:hypothetical protein EJ02DRAFT_260752 [Clathrospora elynae]
MLTYVTEDTSFSAEEQASINVDALVNDNDEHVPGTPITPMSGHLFEHPRRATPIIPPGFAATAIPKTVVQESWSRPGSRPMSRTASSTIIPAVPVVPITPIRAATPSKMKKGKQKSDDNEKFTPAATPVATTAEKPVPATPSRTTAKATVANPQTPKEPTPKEAAMKTRKPVTESPKPMLEKKKSTSEAAIKATPRPKSTPRKNQSITETSLKKETQKETKTTPIASATPTSSTKRQPPGKLDIPAAIKPPADEDSPAPGSSKVNVPSKNVRSLPASLNNSVPPSPAAAMTGSPIKRSVAPKTLRVIPTPKTEVPPPLSAASASSIPQIPTVEKLRSRQASIASVIPPGTPSSEMISDTASITSTSISRASSPPPIGGKVGTAPMRLKTKSQARKDRQERKKQTEEEQAMMEENKSDVEIVQAPIIGRKKKAKKPANTLKPIAATSKSQPASPKPATVEEEHSDTPTTPALRKLSSAKVSASATPELEPEHIAEHSREKREHTAQSILADLQRTGKLLTSTLEFFKPLSSSLTHASRMIQPTYENAPPDLKLHLSEADLDDLAKKKPIRLNSNDGKPDSCTLITPNGKFFWGLSDELEKKALELEKHVEELKGHARFHPRKQAAHPHSKNMATQPQTQDVLPAIATALKEAGKKLNTNGGQQMPRLDPSSGLLGSTTLPLPPVQAPDGSAPQVPPTQQQHTPADAGAYLNQYVIPKTDTPPPNQPRPEMAAVGGAPGAGTANISVNPNRFVKAAKAVVEGGAVGGTEIDGMGMMAADLRGGVFVQGLEALVGAGLGYQSGQEFGVDGNGNITLGQGGGILDVQGLVNAIESTADMGGYRGDMRRRGSVLSVEEAEQALQAARKEHDVLEKKLAALMKKNKKLAMGVGK